MYLRYSVLPALSFSGVLHVAVIEGSVDTDIYEEFIEELLDMMEPYPGPNSVLVMDNAQIHKSDNVKEMASER